MSEITSPIMLDDTGQDLVAEAQNIVTKLTALINAVKPTAADIPLAAISGMTADDVQEGVAELKSNLTNLGNLVCKNYFNTQSIDIDIGFEPTSAKNAVALLFNANQSALILVRLDGTPEIKKVFGNQTWSISKSGTTYTITPSATLWGMTTALIDHN